MKLMHKANRLVPIGAKAIVLSTIAAFSSNALAEYYVVYPALQYVVPPPIVYYQKECVVSKPKHKNPCKHHYKKVAKYKKKTSPIITVYYINQPCGQCNSGCNQVVMPGVQNCGYQVNYGQPLIGHSDYYYMQGISEDAGYGPNIDGNTYDNDIYY